MDDPTGSLDEPDSGDEDSGSPDVPTNSNASANDESDAESSEDAVESSASSPPPYSFDPATVPDLASLIDRTCASSTRTEEVGDAIRGGGAVRFSEVSAAIGEVSVAFWYRVKVERGDDTRPGASLEPLRRADSATWPAPIQEASAEVRELWSALAVAVTHPMASARLHDLCFSAQIGNGRDHAVAAVDGYLALGDSGSDMHDVVEGLCRAWVLARTVGYGSGLADTLDAIRRHVESMLQGPDPKPGLVLPLLEVLAAADESEDVDALIEFALEHFRQSYLVAWITRLQRSRATDADKRSLADRTLVEASLREADDAEEPLVRMHFLTQAAAEAKRYGVKDLRERAVREMQELKDGDLKWMTVRASSELPASVAEGFLRQFDDASDWRTALVAFLMTSSPTGVSARNRKHAESAGASSLRRLFANTRFGRHGLPEKTAATDEEHIHAEMVDAELMHARFQGRLFAEGLRRIAETYGEPPRDELAVFLAEAYRCDFELARAFATALWLFWQEEYEACVHLAVPKVEGSLRSLLILLDEPLYRVEEAERPGQFPGLGVLMTSLTGYGFDEDWQRAIHALLLPDGDNERNLIAHGFVSTSSPSSAALMLRLCGMAVTLAPAGSSDEDRQRALNRLRRPEAPPPRWWKLGVRCWIARVRRWAVRHLG